MIDITKRLRWTGDDAYEAADEIERLRAVNAELEQENRLMNKSIADCAFDVFTASQVNAALLEALEAWQAWDALPFDFGDDHYIKLSERARALSSAAVKLAKAKEQS